MKAHDMNGVEFDITKTEAERIAAEVAKLNRTNVAHETNEAFTNRALDNIEKMTGVRPKSEDELKQLLYDKISGPTKAEVDLVYESVEAIVGWHSMKTKNSM